MNQTKLMEALSDLSYLTGKAVAALNEVRGMLSLPPVTLSAGEPAREVITPLPIDLPITLKVPVPEQPKARRRRPLASPVQKEQMRQAYAIVRQAGLKAIGRPSKELVAQGLKIIAAQREEKKMARAAKKAAKATATAKQAAAEPEPSVSTQHVNGSSSIPQEAVVSKDRRRTNSAKARVGSGTAHRWEIIREAGLTSKTVPSNKLVAKAERIIAERKAHAAGTAQ